MVTALISLLFYGLYSLLEPRVVNLHHSQVVVQAFFGLPVYTLSDGYSITLDGPLFTPHHMLKGRRVETIAQPDSVPEFAALFDESTSKTRLIVIWSVKDPWRVATRIGVPVDWNGIGDDVVMPAVRSAARAVPRGGRRIYRVLQLQKDAREELRRKAVGLDIKVVTVRDAP